MIQSKAESPLVLDRLADGERDGVTAERVQYIYLQEMFGSERWAARAAQTRQPRLPSVDRRNRRRRISAWRGALRRPTRALRYRTCDGPTASCGRRNNSYVRRTRRGIFHPTNYPTRTKAPSGSTLGLRTSQVARASAVQHRPETQSPAPFSWLTVPQGLQDQLARRAAEFVFIHDLLHRRLLSDHNHSPTFGWEPAMKFAQWHAHARLWASLKVRRVVCVAVGECTT